MAKPFVSRAPRPVEVAVPLRTGEGRHHPRIGIGGHDVGVVQQHERRLIAAGKARHDAPPPRGGLEGFVGDALGVEDLRKEGNGAAFVPGGLMVSMRR